MDYSSLMINAVDLIVDGKFELSQIDDERNLVGSKNQRIVYVTDRYKNKIDWFMVSREKKIEINETNMTRIIRENGRVNYNANARLLYRRSR